MEKEPAPALGVQASVRPLESLIKVYGKLARSHLRWTTGTVISLQSRNRRVHVLCMRPAQIADEQVRYFITIPRHLVMPSIFPMNAPKIPIPQPIISAVFACCSA